MVQTNADSADRPKVHPRFNKEGLRSSIDRIRYHDASGDPQTTADAKFLVDELGDLLSWLEGEIKRRDVLLAEAEKHHQEVVTQLQLEMETYHRACNCRTREPQSSKRLTPSEIDGIVGHIIKDCRWNDKDLTRLPPVRPPASDD